MGRTRRRDALTALAGGATLGCASEVAPAASTPAVTARTAASTMVPTTVVRSVQMEQPSQELTPDRFPALSLKIASPLPGAAPEVDFRAAFGAIGDGADDDMPAFTRLAEAVNAGGIAPGTVVRLPAGTYRVPGNAAVTFRRPVPLL